MCLRWRSYLSCFYTSRMPYTPLQSSLPSSDLAAEAGIQRRPSCSPRSMYSLGALVGTPHDLIVPPPDWSQLEMDHLREHALKNIQSKLTTSNIVQELFTLFASKYASNEALLSVIFLLHHPATKQSWIWRSSFSTEALLRRIPNY